MATFRRWYVPGGTVFFTVVTYGRRRLFDDPAACRLLGSVMRAVREELPFDSVASVLLPDHLHAVWSLPAGDADYSTRWQKIKREFTVAWLAGGGNEAGVTTKQAARRNRGVWQKRFFERQVRSLDELERLCAYIHYNPVRHGYAESPGEWRWSTFKRFVEAGEYPLDWGAQAESIEPGFACE